MASGMKIDRNFIQRLNQGEAKAFDQLFADKHKQVYAYCLKLIPSREMAEEIMMDVFLTVWKKREQINADQSLNALLFKITKDMSFDCLKKLARQRKHCDVFREEFSHPIHNPIEVKLLNEEYEQLAHRAIKQLPPQRQVIFKMRRQMDMSNIEIAETLGISKNTVKVQLVKASKFLREYFLTHTDIPIIWILSWLTFC